MQQYLENDIIDARKGNDLAPLAGAFELLKDLRGQLRQYLEGQNALTVDEYEIFLKEFNPIDPSAQCRSTTLTNGTTAYVTGRRHSCGGTKV